MTTYKPDDQTWSWIFVLTGIGTVLLCHRMGIPTDIGAGIIGAGINAFNQVTKNTTIDHALNVTQNSVDK